MAKIEVQNSSYFWVFWLALIVLCWGEPDVLDGIIKKVNAPTACENTATAPK